MYAVTFILCVVYLQKKDMQVVHLIGFIRKGKHTENKPVPISTPIVVGLKDTWFNSFFLSKQLFPVLLFLRLAHSTCNSLFLMSYIVKLFCSLTFVIKTIGF